MAPNRPRPGAAGTQFAVVLASILGSFLGLAARPCHPASRIPKVNGHRVGALRSDADGSEGGGRLVIVERRRTTFNGTFRTTRLAR